MDDKPRPPRRTFLILLLILVPALLMIGWSQASFNLKFIRPETASQTIFLLAVSALVVVAFVIFALILSRILLKLYVERRQQQLGAQFKTKMLAAFLGLSLLPVCFLFIFAYGLLNRSIDKWFGLPFDVVRRSADEITRQLEIQAEQRSLHDAGHLAKAPEVVESVAHLDGAALGRALAAQVAELELAAAWCFDPQGRILAQAGGASLPPAEMARLLPQLNRGGVPAEGVTSRWRSDGSEFFLAALPVRSPDGKALGTVVSVARLPLNMERIAGAIEHEAQKYDQLSRERKAVKRNYLSILCLLTLLLLFAATWFALFLSKQVTVPIQALAEATHEVSRGNLGFQVTARAGDELGLLVRSFNEMTRQLAENRAALERAAEDLQRANRELEERTNTTEVILENVPTGVISFDPLGQITQVNSTAERMLGSERAKSARTLTDLFSPEDAQEISRLFRRGARQGVVARQVELDLEGRRAFVALTVSSIRARHGRVGSVLVMEDLSEVLRAQKAAAWQEVAQRIAHEIKNPLTPIQLSTERIQRLMEREGPGALTPELIAAVAESVSLIGREVETLKRLVDEFSSFARFPASRLVPSSLNTIIEDALDVFDGRLDGIRVHRELARDLPRVPADPQQIKRALVNLIDNAAEALENSEPKEIWVRSALDQDRDVVEVIVADSGPGISPEAKERLFLPYFSTKHRGTGLGLAIVSRIISEHRGTIRVEDNRPTGTRIVFELPVEGGTA